MTDYPDRINASHVRRAIEELGVDVPIYRHRIVGDRIELHCYGGAVLLWPPDPPPPAPPPCSGRAGPPDPTPTPKPTPKTPAPKPGNKDRGAVARRRQTAPAGAAAETPEDGGTAAKRELGDGAP